MDNFFSFPPLNPVKEMILIFFFFAIFAHLIMFLLVPETENASKIKAGIQNVTEAAMKLGEAIYKTSQEAEANGDVDEGPVMDDDILDADFEDLDGDKRG